MPTIFYPSVAVNLVLRFDEALLDAVSPTPRSPAELAESEVAVPNALASSTAGTLSGAGSRLSKRVGTVPRQCSIEKPGYRQAGKFTLTFSFRDFPLDPRAIRALGVEVYIGTVEGTDFARSMLAEKDYGSLAGILSADPANLAMAGVADTISTTYGDNGAEVVIEGRDLRGMFLDARLAPEVLAKLDVSQDIGSLIKQLLGYVPSADKIPIEVSPAAEWPNGVIPKVADASVMTRANKGAEGNKQQAPTKGATGGGNGSGLVFWDMVTQLCFLVGAIPYFEGHTLWIRPVQTIYDRRRTSTPPFKGGKPRRIKTSAGEEELRLRRMVFGRNLRSLSFERKVGGTAKVPSVRVVSNVTDSTTRGPGRILEARYPEEGDDKKKATDVDPSGEDAKDEVITIPVPGIKDETRLKDIARAIHEEIGRSELGGKAASKELASFGGDNSDADILRLNPGDPVEFVADATGTRSVPPVVSELNNLAAMSPGAATAMIAKRLGGDRDLAAVLVGTARGTFQKLQTTFRVDTVRYTWDVTGGIEAEFDFKNYVEARYADDYSNSTADLADKVEASVSATLQKHTIRKPSTAAEIAEKLRRENLGGK